MTPTIRPAAPQDAPGIARILIDLALWKNITPDNSDQVENWIRKQLEEPRPDRMALVAADDADKVLGYTSVTWVSYCFFEGSEGYLTELFMAREARGHGIGTLLLNMVTAEAEARGCTRLLLHNGRESESYKRNFYLKNGWEERDIATIFVNYLH